MSPLKFYLPRRPAILESAQIFQPPRPNRCKFARRSLRLARSKSFAIELPFDEDTFRATREEKLSDQLAEAAIDSFKRRMDKLTTVANPVIQKVFEEKGAMYENILIPITDGKKVYNIAVNLKKAAETQSKEVIREFEKRMLLYVIDDEWKEHLRQLDDLKQSVQNAS